MKKETAIFFILFTFVGVHAQHGIALRAGWLEPLNKVETPFLAAGSGYSGFKHTYSSSNFWKLEVLYRSKKSFTGQLAVMHQSHKMLIRHLYTSPIQDPQLPDKTAWNINFAVLEAGLGVDLYIRDNARVYLKGSYLYYATLSETEVSTSLDKTKYNSSEFDHNIDRNGFLAVIGSTVHLNSHMGFWGEVGYSSTRNFLPYRWGVIPLELFLFNLGMELRLFKQEVGIEE